MRYNLDGCKNQSKKFQELVSVIGQFCGKTICIADCENLTIGQSLEWKLHNPTNHSNTSVSWWLENKRGKQPRPKCCWI